MSSSHHTMLSGLESAVRAIESERLDLHSVSFFLSQPSSKCSQETDNSLNISISKNDASYFSQLLTALGGAKKSRASLRNVEFHQVEWDPDQVRRLGVMLDENGSIRRVVFRKNRFKGESLSVLCEVLMKRSKGVKELVLYESGIGSSGAGLIASALRANDGLEELQIWEDSIGSRGAEELSKMIEVNSSLRVLTVFDSSSLAATPIVSAVLGRNRTMEVNIWSGENGEKSSKVAEFAPESNSLRIYRLDVAGTCRVACALGMNSTVKAVDFTGVRLKSRWAKEFRWVMEQNRTIREVKLSQTWLKDKGVVYVAAGLFKNKGLERLYLDGNSFGGVGIEHLLCPLSRFSAIQLQANVTLKSVTFGGGRTKIGRDGLSAILQMLTTNETVTHLGIFDDESLRPDDFVKIFKGLEKNASLRYFSVKGCKGVKGDMVLQALTETLQVNPWIENIDLTGTPLQVSGKASGIYQRLGQNERTEEPEGDSLKDMPLVMPKSCRVFLCGQEYAGKSTLCHSISQSFSNSSKLPYIDQVRTLVNPVEQAVRQSRMKIKSFKDGDTKISIWNLGGQHEFYSLHDLMFPGHGSATFFLIVSSLFRKPNNREQKTPLEVEEDIQYWLRFIVSNSKRAATRQCILPSVTVVLTHYDKIDQSSSQQIVNSIQRVRDKFQGFVEFYQTVFTVDARSSASVSKLSHHIRKTSMTILQRVPRVYQLCNDLIQILSDWRVENNNKPAMRWREFEELCQIKVPTLRIRRHDNKEKVETRRQAVASCLHHIGEVIYFDELGFLILDSEWFCTEVLGQLTKFDARKHTNGFIGRKELEKIWKGSLQGQIIPGIDGGSKLFNNLEAGDLLRMMLKLELGYEQDPSDPNSPLLIPAILEEGRGRLQRWDLSGPDCLYTGRHLECDDSSHMFLTPGFFPRLQVHLHNRITALKNQHGATYTYSLEKYLISIHINGVHIRVELGGQLGYYIDVLACSTKNLTETLRPIQQLVIPTIHSLCSGVSLTENIIRPECIRNLIPPRFRKTQFVPVPILKQALLSVPADGMYDYQHTWGPVMDSGRVVLQGGFDFARDLLSDDDFREVLHRRYHDLYNLAAELQVPTENNDAEGLVNEEADGRVEPSFSGIAKGVEVVLRRLKIIEQEIRDLKQEIQGLRYYEHRLLIELHRKVNYLVNYNLQVDERKVPSMFYFVRTENYSRRLVTNIILGMTALRLHMLCEYRREMHVVEDQMGCEMINIDNRAIKSLAPYMTTFMKLLTFALKIGAHLAVGMGEMIPDLSREVARLADSSLMMGAAGLAAAGAVGAVAGRGGGRSRHIRADQKAAQQWIVDFLRDRGCSSGRDIAEKFGLWRVRYRDDGQIAWVCRRHLSIRAYEIVEVPI